MEHAHTALLVSDDIDGQFKGHNFVKSRLILRLICVTWKL